MQLFVDVVGPTGTYQPCGGPAFAEPKLPTELLCAVETPSLGSAVPVRLFHVEARRFVSESSLERAGIGELDTVVIVCGDVAARDGEELALLWSAHGGVARKLAHARRELGGGTGACHQRALLH